MISVRNLTKYYGGITPRVCATSPSRWLAGRVVGFLGPERRPAKRQTMRILAGYLTANLRPRHHRRVDVFWNPSPSAARSATCRKSCPLYPEMRVTEYLRYRGGLKGLHGRACTRAVDRSAALLAADVRHGSWSARCQGLPPARRPGRHTCTTRRC